MNNLKMNIQMDRNRNKQKNNNKQINYNRKNNYKRKRISFRIKYNNGIRLLLEFRILDRKY